MGRMSRDKGARYENELVREANAAGLPAQRTATLQAGRRRKGTTDPDVLLKTWPELHVEAKRDERLSVDAMVRQAQADCEPGRVPLVVYRRNRQPSRAVARWAWLLDLLAEVQRLRAENARLRAGWADEVAA